MIVETDSNAKSGPGTSMFSRSGASTISQHKVFKQNFSNIEEFVANQRIKRTHRGGISSENQNQNNYVPQGDISNKLPAIAENEENQAIVEVPGLAEELNRLEKSYKQIQ